jgi:hypothetical protein
VPPREEAVRPCGAEKVLADKIGALDDRPEEAILLLETALVLCQESVEVMK